MRRKPLPDDEPPDPRLSDFAGRKVIVLCKKCELRKQYDATAMLRKIGDIRLPELRPKIAAAEGCEKVGNEYYDRCGLAYDIEAMNAL
nr:hypothetical protein REQ54_01726 [Rhizobium sp. Q54]